MDEPLTASTDWFTPKQVGRLIGGFTAQFIRDEIRAGEIDAEAIRSRSGKMVYYRIRKAAVEAYRQRLAARTSTKKKT